MGREESLWEDIPWWIYQWLVGLIISPSPPKPHKIVDKIKWSTGGAQEGWARGVWCLKTSAFRTCGSHDGLKDPDNDMNKFNHHPKHAGKMVENWWNLSSSCILYKINCTSLKYKYLQNQWWHLHEIFRKFSPHQWKWFWINLMSVSENDLSHCTFFVISNFLQPPSWSTIINSFFERVSLTLKQQKIMGFFLQLALSVTCTETSRLSGGCLQHTGMLEPGILHSKVAAHFGFHRDAVLNLRQHYRMSFTACGCLRSPHQRDVKGTRRLY